MQELAHFSLGYLFSGFLYCLIFFLTKTYSSQANKKASIFITYIILSFFWPLHLYQTLKQFNDIAKEIIDIGEEIGKMEKDIE